MGDARKVKITVISAEQLRFHDIGFFKQSTFVIIRTDSLNFGRTTPESKGGRFPLWNETLHLTLGSTVRSLRVEVYCKTAVTVKMVGEVDVPVSDFAGDLTPAGYLHFLSYRLTDKEGRKNGIINLSVRLEEREPNCGPHLYRISTGEMTGGSFPMKREYVHWPPVGQMPVESAGCSSSIREGGMRGVAVGIPVSHGFPI